MRSLHKCPLLAEGVILAKEYFEKLTQLISDLKIEEDVSSSIEIKHFFSGAALYVNGALCVSWSPSGLAFKLPNSEVSQLISSGEAIPLKYFEKGHIKKDYATFEKPDLENMGLWKSYFIKAIHLV